MLLQGQELLDRVSRSAAVPVAEIVRACGFVRISKSGDERLDYAGFHAALLLASGRGDQLQPSASAAGEPEADPPYAEVFIDGFLALARPDWLPPGEDGMHGLEIGEWDLYYPGSPLYLYAINQRTRDRSFRSVFECRDQSQLLIAADGLKRGQRYVLESGQGRDADPPYLALEPYPWNGIDADDQENLRLLLIPDSDVIGLLSLAMADMPGQLYDDELHQDLEEALSQSLAAAVRAVTQRQAWADSLFSRYGFPLDPSWLRERLKRLWLEPLERECEGLQHLRAVLLGCLEQLGAISG